MRQRECQGRQGMPLASRIRVSITMTTRVNHIYICYQMKVRESVQRPQPYSTRPFFFKAYTTSIAVIICPRRCSQKVRVSLTTLFRKSSMQSLMESPVVLAIRLTPPLRASLRMAPLVICPDATTLSVTLVVCLVLPLEAKRAFFPLPAMILIIKIISLLQCTTISQRHTLDHFIYSELDQSGEVEGREWLERMGRVGKGCSMFINIRNRNLKAKMSILKQKLDKATELYQTHEFKQALAAYEDALAFCYKTREAQSLIFNIMSTKGALQMVLGELQPAMSTLNEVLRTDPNHYLALIRRSQVYKKKAKFNRALKDLEMAATFCPDNLQVAAMKIEIETIKAKNKNSNSSEESESQQDSFNEELQLNFSNLKKIDRKSCSIVVPAVNQRKSRVTISGDTAFEYERQDNCEKSNHSTSASKQASKELYLQTLKQLQGENDKTPLPTSKVVAKPNTRSKSILKNKLQSPSIAIINNNEYKEVRESRLLDKLKDIDGKMLTSAKSIPSQKAQREVEFRKSLFASQEKEFKPVEVAQKKTPKGSRKSCLKRSSFEALQQEEKDRPVRKSKFETLSRKSVDGSVIKNRKSIDGIKGIQMDKIQRQNDGQDSDEGSSYNIFGSNENVMISKQIKQKLGLNREQNKASKGPGKPRATGGKSILKKGSVLMPDLGQKAPETKQEDKSVKKAKKSVMFSKSRFAD